jgi:hypothetical protein
LGGPARADALRDSPGRAVADALEPLGQSVLGLHSVPNDTVVEAAGRGSDCDPGDRLYLHSTDEPGRK